MVNRCFGRDVFIFFGAVFFGCCCWFFSHSLYFRMDFVHLLSKHQSVTRAHAHQFVCSFLSLWFLNHFAKERDSRNVLSISALVRAYSSCACRYAIVLICTHWNASFLFQSLLFHDDVNAVCSAAAVARLLVIWRFHFGSHSHARSPIRMHTH